MISVTYTSINNKLINTPINIGAGQSISDVIAQNVSFVTGLIVPSGWTTADISFSCSVDGTNFYDLYDANNYEVIVSVGSANKFIMLNPNIWIHAPYLKIRSGISSAPVNQVSGSILTLISRIL
jgi:hypothetical protein